ncbi:MAG: hybrid sensor histidine kinase/response regulator [Opitutaceae bacterium]|nr:hybrid sensor histidine kinase/response regulator [Opitutaceae bacterium]
MTATHITPTPVSLAGRKILIVDDDRLSIRILGGILKTDGYVWAEAHTGEGAIQRYKDFAPDLILMDVLMPGIDGFETCRRLKQAYGETSAPVIFITAKTDSDDVVKGLTAGGVDYLPKPFKPKEVLARIRSHLHSQALLEQLSKANAAKNRFLGMAAHDLRNPLASIRGFAEFLAEGAGGPLNADQLEMVQSIHSASQSMLDMVNELLDVATIEAGELKLNIDQHNLRDVVAKSVALTNMEAAKKKTHITFVPPAAPIAPYIDAAKMKQVIDNLLSNAVKYSPPGSSIAVLASIDEAAGTCSVAVRDQGPGIPESERDKLFKDFGRLSSKPTGGEKSTGLGLAIVRKIVEAHGGTITAENLPAQGCEFRFIIPLTQ